MADHDESKLPRWVRNELQQLRTRIAYLESNETVCASMKEFLGNPQLNWCVLKNIFPSNDGGYLWTITENTPRILCHLDEKDVVFVGRHHDPVDFARW